MVERLTKFIIMTLDKYIFLKFLPDGFCFSFPFGLESFEEGSIADASHSALSGSKLSFPVSDSGGMMNDDTATLLFSFDLVLGMGLGVILLLDGGILLFFGMFLRKWFTFKIRMTNSFALNNCCYVNPIAYLLLK